MLNHKLVNHQFPLDRNRYRDELLEGWRFMTSPRTLLYVADECWTKSYDFGELAWKFRAIDKLFFGLFPFSQAQNADGILSLNSITFRGSHFNCKITCHQYSFLPEPFFTIYPRARTKKISNFPTFFPLQRDYTERHVAAS